MNVVQRIAVLSVTQQGIEALVVVGSLAPALGGDEVIVGHDTSLRRLGVLGVKEGIEGLGSLLGIAHSFEGLRLVEVVSGLLLVDIIGIDTWALLVLAEQFAQVAIPFQGITVATREVTGVDDVNESGKSALVGLVRAVLLHVLEVLLVCLLEPVRSSLTRGAETCLAATDVDEQVHVVAGGVVILLL